MYMDNLEYLVPLGRQVFVRIITQKYKRISKLSASPSLAPLLLVLH